MIDTPSPLRLRLDGEALVANWRTLDRMSGSAACGAAIKADGYGLGAEGVATRLAKAGCRDFFVSNWREAAALAHLGLPLAVLHGVREEDMPAALAGIAKPVLNTPAQVARWKAAGGGVCDVMVDTGMNRLGLGVDDLHLLDGLEIDTLMSHLACADEDVPMNERQRGLLAGVSKGVDARRVSLANTAGIALGTSYAFDLTRPGLGIYGGSPGRSFVPSLQQVVFPQAQVVQRRRVRAGQSVGYSATWIAEADVDIAILNIGYADGYRRGFSNRGYATYDGQRLSVLGRVSMDLVAVSAAPSLVEGSWVTMSFALEESASSADISPYELLTGLGMRLSRTWSEN